MELRQEQIQELYELYDQLQEEIKDDKLKNLNDFCNNPECEGDFINYKNMKLCKICGSADEDSYVLEKLEEGQYIKKKYFYKRRIYFIDRLKYMTGIKRTNKKDLIEFTNSINKNDVNNIQDLYKLLKKKKLSKYYKDIYNIYFDVKKIRLINFNYKQISKLSKEFVEIDIKYKSYNNSKKNMLAYNSIIYYLLKKYKIDGYEHILTPSNHKENMLKIIRIDTIKNNCRRINQICGDDIR
jgi:hypothetical protein